MNSHITLINVIINESISCFTYSRLTFILYKIKLSCIKLNKLVIIMEHEPCNLLDQFTQILKQTSITNHY